MRWRDRARRANGQKSIPGRTRSVRLASRYREVTAEVLFFCYSFYENYSYLFFLLIPHFILFLCCNQLFIDMLFKVAKHSKSNDPQRPQEPVIYVVEEGELLHFLHENLKPSSGNVLVFDSFPEENLYLLSNDKD